MRRDQALLVFLLRLGVVVTSAGMVTALGRDSLRELRARTEPEIAVDAGEGHGSASAKSGERSEMKPIPVERGC